jgi:hypothetical protein
MRPCLILAVVTILAAPCRAAAAQSTARDSVISTVQQVFDRMRSRDTSGMRQLFDSTARLIGTRDTTTAIRPRTVSQFLASVAATPAERFSDERMFDPEVRIDGPVAQVWTHCTFRTGATFSHCGTDAVTLIRVGGSWRIVNFIWNVRTEGCTHRE